MIYNVEWMYYQTIVQLKLEEGFDEVCMGRGYKQSDQGVEVKNNSSLSDNLKFLNKQELRDEFISLVDSEYLMKWRKYYKENKENYGYQNVFRTGYSVGRPKLLIFSRRKLLVDLIKSRLYNLMK